MNQQELNIFLDKHNKFMTTLMKNLQERNYDKARFNVSLAIGVLGKIEKELENEQENISSN